MTGIAVMTTRLSSVTMNSAIELIANAQSIGSNHVASSVLRSLARSGNAHDGSCTLTGSLTLFGFQGFLVRKRRPVALRASMYHLG